MKILIAAGGSGGHVFPALCVGDELKKENHNIRFVTTEGLMVDKIKRKGYDLVTVCSRGLSLSSLRNLWVSASCMIRAIGQSFRI